MAQDRELWAVPSEVPPHLEQELGRNEPTSSWPADSSGLNNSERAEGTMSMASFVGTLRTLIALCALLGFAGGAGAQTVIATSSDTRFQLDCHVSDAALRALLPPGFTTSVAAKGPAKDANLRVIFIDRLTVDGSNNKSSPIGPSQLVYLVAPVRDASGIEAQLVVGGLTDEQADAPGVFGNYLLASTHTMRRSVSNVTGKVVEAQDWVFAAPTGEHLEMHIQFERGAGFKLGPADVKFYSARNMGFYEISRQEQHLDILRNLTTAPPDRVKEFSFQAGGGSYAKLFDGSEKLLSWDNVLWLNSSILQP